MHRLTRRLSEFFLPLHASVPPRSQRECTSNPNLSGGRLGYGGGYYDRFLERCSPRCRLIAVAFELQIVEHVPCADHDARIHNIVTEKRVIDCPAACQLR